MSKAVRLEVNANPFKTEEPDGREAEERISNLVMNAARNHWSRVLEFHFRMAKA